jgi:hypothetical protein
MVYGRVTTKGYSMDNVSGLYPSLEDLNYQQSITSRNPYFYNHEYISPMDPLINQFKYKFGVSKKNNENVIHFPKAYSKGSIKGLKYEIFPKNKIVIGTKTFKIGDRVGNGNQTFIITNIGVKRIIIKSGEYGNIEKRLNINNFISFFY